MATSACTRRDFLPRSQDSVVRSNPFTSSTSSCVVQPSACAQPDPATLPNYQYQLGCTNIPSTTSPLCIWAVAPAIDASRAKLIKLGNDVDFSLPPRHTATAKLDLTNSRWRQPESWFIFPAEIRNMIYKLCARCPDAANLYRGYYAKIHAYHQRRLSGQKEEQFPVHSSKLVPRTILLLCRRIYAEAIHFTKESTLVIDRLPPWAPGTPNPLLVSQFIGRCTLQNIRYIELRPDLGQGSCGGSARLWARLVDDMLDILLERNNFVHLNFVLRMCQINTPNVWMQDFGYYHHVLHRIETMRLCNPNAFHPGTITTEFWELTGPKAYQLEVNSAIYPPSLKRIEGETPREYPDQKFWPGSIMEYV